jgi:hypothetical protein
VKRAGVTVLGPCVNRSRSGWTQEVSGLRAGLSAIRSLSADAVHAIVEQRDQASPFASLADFKRRTTLSHHDLALLVRSGAFDCLGRGRTLLLREANLGAHGHLPSSWREPVELWPLDLLAGHPFASSWREQWGLLGFLPGPLLMGLVRPLLPSGLADSRTLPNQDGEQVRLAGLLCKALPEEGEPPPELLTLEDEYGVVDVRLSDVARETPVADLGPLVLVEGRVMSGFGVPGLVAAGLQRPLPGTTPTTPQAIPRPGRNGVHTAGRAAS